MEKEKSIRWDPSWKHLHLVSFPSVGLYFYHIVMSFNHLCHDRSTLVVQRSRICKLVIFRIFVIGFFLFHTNGKLFCLGVSPAVLPQGSLILDYQKQHSENYLQKSDGFQRYFMISRKEGIWDYSSWYLNPSPSVSLFEIFSQGLGIQFPPWFSLLKSQIIVTLWIFSVLGKYFSTLNLLYIGKPLKRTKTRKLVISYPWLLSVTNFINQCFNMLSKGFLCLETMPALYVKYKDEIDYLASRVSRDARKMLKKLDSRVLYKIPRGPVKERRIY